MKERINVKPMQSARKLALMALSDVVSGGAYAGLALNKRLAASALSPEDKRLATNIFYTALENRLRISYVLAQFVAKMPELIVEQILHISVAQLLFMDRLPDYAVVNEAVGLAKQFGKPEYAPLINGALRNVIRARDASEIEYPSREANPVRYMSVMYSMPEPIVARLVADYGADEAEKIVSYRPDEHWESVRYNPIKLDARAFEAYMDKKRWEYKPGTAPGSYRIKGAGSLAGDSGFDSGLYTIQGESSMLAALAVGARPGMRIVDACAAPGGKTALMAAEMSDTGRVYAFEPHPHRVALIKATAGRLGLTNVHAIETDARVKRESLADQMDGVLVDAPCSGLGVISGKPDLKYKLKDTDFGSLSKLQGELLDACSCYVKRGGILVYSTCTLIREENAARVEAFLAAHPEFEPDKTDSWLPEQYRPKYSSGMIQFFAHRDEGMDGFFIARMRRVR